MMNTKLTELFTIKFNYWTILKPQDTQDIYLFQVWTNKVNIGTVTGRVLHENTMYKQDSKMNLIKTEILGKYVVQKMEYVVLTSSTKKY